MKFQTEELGYGPKDVLAEMKNLVSQVDSYEK